MVFSVNTSWRISHIFVFDNGKLEFQEFAKCNSWVETFKISRHIRNSNTFTELYNLQTLQVNELEQQPGGSRTLINLRHFHFEICQYGYEWRCSLRGIGQLTNLQTLPFFKVSQEKGCQIEELEHLPILNGSYKFLAFTTSPAMNLRQEQICEENQALNI